MRGVSLAWILTLLLGAVVVAGLGPALPVLLRERALADEVRRLAEVDARSRGASLRNARDPDLRRKTQALARTQGFSLPLEGVVVGYGNSGARGVDDPFEAPARIGYTLPIKLPLFGFFPYTLLAARVFDIPP